MDSNGQFLVSLIKTDQIWHKQCNFIEKNLIVIEYIETRYIIKKYWILWFPKNIFCGLNPGFNLKPVSRHLVFTLS